MVNADEVLSMGPKRLVLTLAIRIYYVPVLGFSYILLRLKRVSLELI